MRSDILENKLSVFVPTHLVHSRSDSPLVENWMIFESIRSFHYNMGLQNARFTIYMDSFHKKINLKGFNEYKSFLLFEIKILKGEGINICLAAKSGDSLRENYELHLQSCNSEYILFLEHDWKLKEKISMQFLLDEMDKHSNINYLKLTNQGMPLTKELYADIGTNQNWNWIMEEIISSVFKIPLSRISFISGNPHIQRVKFFKDYLVPELSKHIPLNRHLKGEQWEKDIKSLALLYMDNYRQCNDHITNHQWPLTINGNFGNGCIQCKKSIVAQHINWGIYLYGIVGMGAIIEHLGSWCRKS